MKKTLLALFLIASSTLSCLAVETKNPKLNLNALLNANKQQEYSIQLKVTNIPPGQQTLFVPVRIDTSIADFERVSLEGLGAQNILAVVSNSRDRAGTGVGLLKFDDKGLPETLTLKVFLKPINNGQTTLSLIKVAEESALPAKGIVIDTVNKVSVKSLTDLEVTEKLVKNKKRLYLNQQKLTLNIERPAKAAETIFIPFIFDKKIVDIDETFGHTIVSTGISMKSYSAKALDEGGSGVELVLTEAADKDFEINIDLLPRSIGKSKLLTALPQKTHSAVITGPIVEISPAIISIAKK